jgi:hypothetical protein
MWAANYSRVRAVLVGSERAPPSQTQLHKPRVRDRLPLLSDKEWSWPMRVVFPYVVSSSIEQRGCTKSTPDEVCLALSASRRRSGYQTH